MNIRKKLTDSKVLGSIGNFISENAATISMIVGIIGVVGAVYEAYKASDEVSKENKEFNEKVEEIESSAVSEGEKTSAMKTVKIEHAIKVVCIERKALICGGVAVGCSIFSNYRNGITISTLATALAMKEDKLKAIVKNVKEELGTEKFKEIEDKSFEELVSRNFITEDGPKFLKPSDAPWMGDIYIDTAIGAQIFQFQGTEQEMIEALQNAERYCNRCHGLEVEKYYSFLGYELPKDEKMKGLFWGPNRPFHARIGERTIKGCTFKTIEHDYMPTSAKLAGCPLAI